MVNSNGSDAVHLFAVENAVNFDSDISSWDVSSVTDMAYMFRGASSFNSNLAFWNVSFVTDMSHMFDSAISFNQNLCRWGELLDSSVLVEDAFEFTACAEVDAPDFARTPPGPFCYACT